MSSPGRAGHRPAHRLSARRAGSLGPLLDRFARDFDVGTRIGFDPVEFPRRYRDPADQEVAGLSASALAYGRADLFKPQLERVLAAMGPSPARFCEALAAAPRPGLFGGFAYRFNGRPTWRRSRPPSGTCGGSTGPSVPALRGAPRRGVG